jgi:hypothetical protein
MLSLTKASLEALDQVEAFQLFKRTTKASKRFECCLFDFRGDMFVAESDDLNLAVQKAFEDYRQHGGILGG